MPAQTLSSATLRALKNSRKGRIKYDPFWWQRGEHILAGLSSVPLQKSCFLSSSSEGSSPRFSAEISSSVSPSESVLDLSGRYTTFSAAPQTFSDEAKNDDPAIFLLSLKPSCVAGRIIKFKEERREKAKLALILRQEMQEKMVAAVASYESEQLKCFEKFMELKQRQEYQSMRDMMDRETKDSIGRQEKLKEEHRHRMKLINLRLRKAEQQSLQETEQQSLQEAELKPQADSRERLHNQNTIQERILKLNQLLGQVKKQTEQAQQEAQKKAELQVQQEAQKKAELQAQQEAQKKAELQAQQEAQKTAALQAQQEAQKKAELQALTKAKAKRKVLQNSAEESTLKWYMELQESADQCSQSIKQLLSSKDTQTKKLKNMLHKAACVPVSQISTNSGSQLRQIFDKIDKLLSGQLVEAVGSVGSYVSTSQHPQGLDFVSFKLAERFVKQGEDEVASHHEAAFPIAMVASGIWELHPRVGELFLAHLHKKCPYAIPHYPPMKAGTPVEEYQRILGYHVDDSGVEEQDYFLKRMSGMIRLYAAVIQLRWPYGSKHGAAPHALNHGWRWLAQMLNMEPLVEISATMLFDFLEVCGNALMKQYQAQFWKLILLLKEEYVPRIEAVTSSTEMGSLTRLKEFLEMSLQSRQIPPPKGQLSSAFWAS